MTTVRRNTSNPTTHLWKFAVVLVIGTTTSQAQTGVLKVTVKDVQTHIALQANLTLQGPQSAAVQTNDAGRATLALTPGEYLIEVSATSHKTLRTRYDVAQNGNLPFTIFLDPVSPPADELPASLSSSIRPGFTLLHGYTVDAETGKPIAGVKVRAAGSNVETETDSNGHYLLSVPTPVAEHPGGAGTETLIFKKQGYSSEEFDNFEVTGDEMRWSRA